MALWVAVVALASGLGAIVAGVEPNYPLILRSFVELGAVVGVFTLICAAEASN